MPSCDHLSDWTEYEETYCKKCNNCTVDVQAKRILELENLLKATQEFVEQHFDSWGDNCDNEDVLVIEREKYDNFCELLKNKNFPIKEWVDIDDIPPYEIPIHGTVEVTLNYIGQIEPLSLTEDDIWS